MANTPQNKKIGRFYDGINEETCHSKEECVKMLTDDYVRGLIEGDGHFGIDRRANGGEIPEFVLKMNTREKVLIEAIRDYLGVKNRVYEYQHNGRRFAMLIIRDVKTLKNKIVPLFRGKLIGYKGTQFEWWLKYFPYLNGLVYRKKDFDVSQQTFNK